MLDKPEHVLPKIEDLIYMSHMDTHLIHLQISHYYIVSL